MIKRKMMSTQEQLDNWIAGTSIHNTFGEECCPDFSCCNPKLLAPKEERMQFAKADETKRSVMLVIFLGRMLKANNMEVLFEAKNNNP